MKLRRAAGLLVALVVGLGCDLDHRSNAMDWTLADGSSIGELARRGPIVLVLVDPGQWFRCLSVLAEWLEWERRSGADMRLLLSREPADRERRILLAAGIRTDGYLTGVRIESHLTPIELVADTNGIIFRAERAYGPSGPLLEALRDGRSVREAVEALGEQEPGAHGTKVEESQESGMAWYAEPQPHNQRRV